jgi:hypothetical protein
LPLDGLNLGLKFRGLSSQDCRIRTGLLQFLPGCHASSGKLLCASKLTFGQNQSFGIEVKRGSQLSQAFLEFLRVELGNNLPGLHWLTFGNGEFINPPEYKRANVDGKWRYRLDVTGRGKSVLLRRFCRRCRS